MTLAVQEREKYESIWSIPAYAENSPGEKVVPVFLDMAKPTRHDAILDAGCGSGKGAVALLLAGLDFKITLCDLTPDGLTDIAQHFPFFQAVLWEDLRRPGRLWGTKQTFDWVYCCDVLEHIPPTFAMLVISRLLEVATKGVFLSISLMPDEFGAFTGMSLHQTVQPYPVWVEQLSALATIRESRDLLSSGVFLLEPRS